MNTYTATYSPDDNKLRLYAVGKLDPDTYATVKAAGFAWAPKQDLFVAPMWTPSREDLLLSLCGDIDDEDTSMTERAEERAERFEGYSERRTSEAEQAHTAVKALTNNIPMGQPILIGHHSERHARKDAERIENGMRRAVRLWDTARYWEQRAAGAIRHAKYKELPAVRARRIKGIEADRRKQAKIKERSETFLSIWGDPTAKLKRKDGQAVTLRAAVVHLSNLDGSYFIASHTRPSGYTGPLSLWEAAGGNIDGADPEARAIATPEEICKKATANHAEMIAYAERWITHYDRRLVYEKALLAADGGTVADKTGPEKGGACKCWASPGRGWSYIQKVNKVSVTVFDNWGNGGANFTRTIPFDKLSAVMTAAEVQEARDTEQLIECETKDANGTVCGFFLRNERLSAKPASAPVPEPERTDYDTIKTTLEAGIQTVVAPQLFPTPLAIAERMVELAQIKPGQRVLEPSAGTGNLVKALPNIRPNGSVVAVEVNHQLATALEPWADEVHCADFLACNGNLGTFDRILMNPPFERGADIQHIQHAMGMLKPGGRLVALCANGPRQQGRLKSQADYWEELPAGSFQPQGTNVNVALLVITTKEDRP